MKLTYNYHQMTITEERSVNAALIGVQRNGKRPDTVTLNRGELLVILQDSDLQKNLVMALHSPPPFDR